MQRIAVIGTGISGLTAAFLLSDRHEVTVFEANDYVGGHTHTVTVPVRQGQECREYQVDTGFIVCNDRTYPNFLRLLARLGVSLQETEMSFSVSNPLLGIEYNGHNLNTLFSQRRNLFRPEFLRLVLAILRFNRAARARLNSGEDGELTLDGFLHQLGLSNLLRDNYLLPMVAAIWSCSVKQAGRLPLDFFLRFFSNHGLLDLRNRPQWYVLSGGSHAYVEPLIRPFRKRLLLNSPVTSVRRCENGTIEVAAGNRIQAFDQVVIASHSDQALAMLAEPTASERQILGDIPYQDNSVILHTDSTLMPAHRRTWASWNFLAGRDDEGTLPVVTYCMNILQRIGSVRDQNPLLVSLNADELIAPDRILRRFRYAHPVYSPDSTRAQSRRNEICGSDRIHYCGAYWYDGFHEDGVRSALDVCSRLGVSL